MPTHRWYIERTTWLVTGFVAGATVWFAGTGFCIRANGLYWLGAEPRLAHCGIEGFLIAPEQRHD